MPNPSVQPRITMATMDDLTEVPNMEMSLLRADRELV